MLIYFQWIIEIVGVGKMKTVVIIDDDPVFSDELEQKINSHPDFRVVAKAQSWRDGKPLTSHHQPDVVIVDVIMPHDDGIKVLKYIRENFDFQPYIYIVTGVNTKSMLDMLGNVEVDFFGFKPIDDECLSSVLSQISANKSKVTKGFIPDRLLADITDDVLAEIGVRPDLSGFLCIKTAIYFLLDNPKEPRKVLQAVATILDKTRYSVDKNIRTAVESCTTTELYRDLFGKYKESNLTFLCGLAVYVEKRLRESDNQ